METIRKFAEKHIYVFSLLIATLSIFLLFLSNYILNNNEKLPYNIIGISIYLIPLSFTFLIAYATNFLEVLKKFKTGIGIGLILGWPFIVVGIYNFILIDFNQEMPSFNRIIAFTIIMLLLGLFEELLCRGILLNNMLKKWGNSKNGIIKSVILSSVIFGVGHLINLLVTPALVIRTFTQVIYASLHGILFASIYLRSKNIWSVILIHAIYDWLILFNGLIKPVSTSTSSDISLITGLITIAYVIPHVLIAFYYLRKVNKA